VTHATRRAAWCCACVIPATITPARTARPSSWSPAFRPDPVPGRWDPGAGTGTM